MYYNQTPQEHHWRSTVGNIINALITTIAVPIGLVIIYLIYIMSTNPHVSSHELYYSAGIFAVLLCLVALGLVIWYLVALSNFANLIKEPTDRKNAQKIPNSYFLMLIGNIAVPILMIFLGESIIHYHFLLIIFTCLPFIISAIGYGIMISGFNGLSSSPTFNRECKSGFTNLKTSCILSLIALFISIISDFVSEHEASLLLNLANLGIGIASIVLMFMGWSKVKNNCPYIEDEDTI